MGSDLGRQARPVVYTQVGQEHASGGDEDRSLQLHAGYLSSQSSSLELVLCESPGAQLQAPRDSGSRLIQEGDDMWRGGRGEGGDGGDGGGGTGWRSHFPGLFVSSVKCTRDSVRCFQKVKGCPQDLPSPKETTYLLKR